MVLVVDRVMRELNAVIVGKSADTGRGTGNGVCPICARGRCNDTGNRVYVLGCEIGMVVVSRVCGWARKYCSKSKLRVKPLTLMRGSE